MFDELGQRRLQFELNHRAVYASQEVLEEALTEHPIVREAARMAYAFKLDPLTPLAGSHVQYRARRAAFRVIDEDIRRATETRN